MHSTAHGYVNGIYDMDIISATVMGRKPDSTLRPARRGGRGKPVWPSVPSELMQGEDFGYTHIV
jgi:hypothetical protein